MPFNDHSKRRHVLCQGTACRLAAWLSVLVLVLVLAFFYGDRFAITARPISDPPDRPGAGYPTQIYYGPANSIAVLPFDNERPAVASTADSFLPAGFAESLITQLLGNPKLQVTSRSSSFFFKDDQVELSIVAERLKVTYLLEGSIQEVAGKVRVKARLLRMNPDKELWSESFIGTRAGLGGVRDEITNAVTSTMNQPAGIKNPGKKLNPEVWLLVLEGRELLHLKGLENLQQAKTRFDQALEIDPVSGAAWLGLAETYLDPSWPTAGAHPGYEQARKAARTALEINPALAGAYLVLSKIRRTFDWDWKGAREAAQQALKLRPGDADVLSNASDNEFTFGKFEKAVELLEETIRRDPVVLPHLLGLGLLYEFSGDYDQALIVYRQLLGLNPDYPAAHAYRARVKLAQDNPESALREADQEQNPFWQRYARILALIALDRFDEADPLIKKMILENAHDAAYQIAEIHAFRGDVETAFEWLDRAYEQRDGGMSEIIGNQFLAALEEDVRWTSLLSQMGLR